MNLFDRIALRKKLIRIAKRILGIHQNQTLSLKTFRRNIRLKYGHYIWRKNFDTQELLSAMQALGMKKGSNVFIHCNWDEFYNYTGNEKNLIDGILNIIGEDGTLIMPSYPLMRKGKIFNVKKTVTAAGLLAEEFRKYPGVKRSINVQHSVCALGPQSDFLLSEHHKCETCWDEKSPYYKLAEVNALVFGLGLGKYYLGTIIHCVESVLRPSIKYFSDFYQEQKTRHPYIDYDNLVKNYECYDLKQNLKRKNKINASKIICKRYLNESSYKTSQISNLQISMVRAADVIPKLIELAKKGIIIYSKPSKRGYKFEL